MPAVVAAVMRLSELEMIAWHQEGFFNRWCSRWMLGCFLLFKEIDYSGVAEAVLPQLIIMRISV